MSYSIINKFSSGLTRVDHEAVSELHGLGTGSTKFAGDDNFATLGAGFHNETKDTITRSEIQMRFIKKLVHIAMDLPPNGKTTEELIPQTLALRNCRESTVLNLFGVQFERVLGELEPLLNERSQLADATSLLAKDFLCVGGTDDDLTRILMWTLQELNK